MKVVFEKRIDLYNRFLKREDLIELDRLMLENKREWNMSHLLSLIINEETTTKIRPYEAGVSVRKGCSTRIINNGAALVTFLHVCITSDNALISSHLKPFH